MHPLRFIRTMLILLTGFLFACAQVNSQDQKPLPTQIPQCDAILVGTAWYPGQWPESRREEDLRLMEAANIKVVRMAEFSWSRLEPSGGHYDLDWLNRVITALRRQNGPRPDDVKPHVGSRSRWAGGAGGIWANLESRCQWLAFADWSSRRNPEILRTIRSEFFPG